MDESFAGKYNRQPCLFSVSTSFERVSINNKGNLPVYYLHSCCATAPINIFMFFPSVVGLILYTLVLKTIVIAVKCLTFQQQGGGGSHYFSLSVPRDSMTLQQNGGRQTKKLACKKSAMIFYTKWFHMMYYDVTHHLLPLDFRTITSKIN